VCESRCAECQKAICNFCVIAHSRQAQSMCHELCEISVLLRAQEVLEDKLAQVRETKLEETLRTTAEEEEIEREKQTLSARFKVEQEEREREVEEKASLLEQEVARIKVAAEEEARRRKAEEEESMLKLEEKQACIKAASEEKARHRNTAEGKLILEKQKLEEALAKVKVVVPLTSPRSNLGPKTTSPRPATRQAALPQDISTVEDWLNSISLQQYAGAIKEYGYDSLKALDAALQADLEEMTNDPAVDMKKPHRRLLIEQWQKRI